MNSTTDEFNLEGGLQLHVGITRQAYAGYAKQTLACALPATRKRYAHRLANVGGGTDIQNGDQNAIQNDASENTARIA
jgi:hypothetical protein